MYGQKRIGLLMQSGLAALSSFAMLGQSINAFGALPQHRFPSGRIYISRSRYTPGGPGRNCGDRGISPKLTKRAAL